MEHVPALEPVAYREYALTKRARELSPVIVALRQWGESYLFFRGKCGGDTQERKHRWFWEERERAWWRKEGEQRSLWAHV